MFNFIFEPCSFIFGTIAGMIGSWIVHGIVYRNVDLELTDKQVFDRIQKEKGEKQNEKSYVK